ncbi:MAG TPA: DUF5916 domain-containing protein [Thermoanaerobaculia bacterium]
MRRVMAVFVVAIAVSSGVALAQNTPKHPAPPPINIHRASGPITVDGDLSDAGWKDAAKIEQWVEGSPGDNIPAKVKTIAYLTYDDGYFYIGIRCEDPEPKKIRAPYVERDAVLGTDDNIAVFLDTRGEKRTALELRVNPRGIQGDGYYDDAGGVEDFSPDYFYDTAAHIDEGGWSAEYRIPFSSLRYSSRNPTWNILIWRNYPRDFRYAFYTSPVWRDANCLVCNSAPIVGLTDLPEAGHLTVAPYVSSQHLEQATESLGNFNDRSLDNNVGADLKWTPTATAAIDATINPDFSQVEADVPQITVNQRFAVFFQEKRPFFLEGFDLFNTPLQVAYTRTITSPRAGLRATARAGDTTYTVLAADDRGGGLTIIPGAQSSDFAAEDFRSENVIARARHELGQSYVGGILTDREISGGGHNRVVGPDFLWRPNQSNTVSGQLLYSDTQNPNQPELSSAWNGQSSHAFAATAAWNHLELHRDFGLGFTQYGDNFRADLGFIPQVGYRDLNAFYALRFYPEHSKIAFLRTVVAYDHQVDLHGNTLFSSPNIGLFAIGVHNLNLQLNLHPQEKVLFGTQTFTQNYLNWFVQIDPSRRVTRLSLQGRAGEATDFTNLVVGRSVSLGATATFRPIDRTTLEFDSNHEIQRNRGANVYTAQVERIRALYSFSSSSILRLITQYDDVNRHLSQYPGIPVAQHSGDFLGSLLYSYKLNWQTVLYLGYGDDRILTERNDLLKSDRSIFFKVSYAIQR